MTRREEILMAADHMFGQVGFDATSTREIAAMCGVNKSLIHYHFQNKEGLLSSVLDAYYQRLSSKVLAALSSEGTFKARVLRLVDAYADFLAANQGFCRIVQRESSGGNNVDKIVKHMVPLCQLGAKLLVDSYPSTARGDFAAEQIFVSVYGMIITYFTYGDVLRSLLQADPADPKQLELRKRHIRRMVSVMFDAIEENDHE